MAKLDNEIRLAIERLVDAIVDDPAEQEENLKASLLALGIKPDLERSLSYFTGFAVSLSTYLSAQKFGTPRMEDISGAIRILRRRSDEIRQTFMRLRINI